MHSFASGWKRSYYGKADVTVYRLRRPDSVFGASVTMLLYGDAFWPTYTTGDNTGLVATDSMKNFIQWETRNFEGADLEQYCRFLAARFLATYPQTEGIQVEALEIPYHGQMYQGQMYQGQMYQGQVAFEPGGPERAMARVEITQKGVVEARAGIHGFRLLRLGGSAFAGFVRDQYTTLPEVSDRPLHMWLDLEWVSSEAITPRVRELVREVFCSFESGSIQQVIYQIGAKLLEELPAVSEVHLEANNRTWDRSGDSGEICTDPRPPFGVLGLSLRR